MAETKAKTINERFLLALKNMKDPIKDTSAYKYSYSKLPQITGIIRPALQEQGLDFSQRAINVAEGDKYTFILETRIFDKDSEVILDRRPLCFTADAQKTGSYETYMRRYALLTVFGLAPKDEDDDGYITTTAGNKQKTKPAVTANSVADGVKKQASATIHRYCELHNADEKTIKNGILKRPNYADTVEFWTGILKEFEEAIDKDNKGGLDNE